MTNNAMIRVLHLEDVSSDAELVDRQLKKGGISYERALVINGDDYKAALDKWEPDIVLSDHSLPDISSVEAFHILKNKYPLVPFILITATVSEEFAVNMMKEGIADYILKDRLQRLPQAVNNALEKVDAHRRQENFYKEIISKEKRFRALIENTEEAIVLADRELNITYRSPSAEKITGFKDSERASHHFLESTHPDDLPLFKNALKELLDSPGKPVQLTFRTKHRQNHYIWLELIMTNLLEDKDVQSLVANFRDITQRKNAELQLQKTGKHFRALIENISDAIILIDENGIVRYHSPSVKRTTGYDFADTFGRTIFDFFQVEDRDRARSFLNSVIQRPEIPIQNTFRLKHKNGNYIWVEGTITNLLADESVKAFIINYRDVTERKMSEDRIKKSEANLQTIFNNTKVAYVLLDRDYRIISYNALAKERYSREMNVDLRENALLTAILPSSKSIEIAERLNRLLAGERVTYETSFDNKVELSWYQIDMFPVYDENKNLLGVILSSEDITERKTQELVKEKMTGDLLRHNKNLEQFAYIISHNLRSPVANLLGLVQLLKDHERLSQEDFQRCIEGVSQSVHKLDDVILDLNYILQSRRGIDEKREHVHFEELIDDIKAIISSSLEKERVTISTSFGVQSIYSVKSYLHSILLNLITNSIKYRRPDTPLTVQVQSFKNSNKVTLTVVDNGLGIDLRQHGEKLFGLYKKFHFHRDGKGMGLYMVRTQVEILGGTIEVSSQVNEGTTFTITFPDVPAPGDIQY